jgi:hypothetical protein
MAYLASTNSVFGARSTTVKPNPVQYCYMQTSDIVQSGNFYLTKKASFTLDTACTNVVDDLFLPEALCGGTGIVSANIKFPITGIWSLRWTTRFANSSAENATWLAVQNSKFYNDTTGNRRLATNGTAATKTNLTWTGYVDAGDVFALCAHSLSTGESQLSSQSCVWLLLDRYTRLSNRALHSATPVIPPVITS